MSISAVPSADQPGPDQPAPDLPEPDQPGTDQPGAEAQAGAEAHSDAKAAGNNRPAARGGWPGTTVAILFGLFYAYDLFAAISNLVGLATGLTNKSLVPWVPLIVGVLVPPIVFVVAFWIGKRQNLFPRALVFLVGLAAAAAVSLSIEAYVQTLFR